MSQISATHDVPFRAGAQSHAGIAALLAFQVIVVIFGLLLILAHVWPTLLAANVARAEAKALLISIYITLPIGLIGTVLGLVGVVQHHRRRKIAAVSMLLCALHTLICLVAISW